MEYNKSYVDRLIELYYNGEATLEQERELKAVLSALPGEGLEPEWKIIKSMFGYFSEASEAEAPKVDYLPEPVAGKKPVSIKFIYASAVAAMLVLAVTMGFLFGDKTDVPDNTGIVIYGYLNGEPITDPDIAARQLRMASRIIESGVRASEGSIDRLKEKVPSEQLQKALVLFGEQQEEKN